MKTLKRWPKYESIHYRAHARKYIMYESSPSNKCNKIKGRFLKRLFTVPHFPFFSCLINAPFTFSSLYWTPLSNKCLLFITHPSCICSKIPTSFPGFSGNEVAKMLGNSEIEQNHSGSQVFALSLHFVQFLSSKQRF